MDFDNIFDCDTLAIGLVIFTKNIALSPDGKPLYVTGADGITLYKTEFILGRIRLHIMDVPPDYRGKIHR